MKKQRILFLLVFVVAIVQAQEWVARYNGPGNYHDMAYDLSVDDAGNVYITGWVSDADSSDNYITIKYDNDGNEMWAVQYNGPANDDDEATSLAVDDSGYVYVTGISYGIGTNVDIATIRYDRNGNEIWVKRFNGSGNGWDYGWALVLDDSSNVYVAGMSVGETTMPDFITIKYDRDGNEIWAVRYTGVGLYNLGGYAIVLDSSRNVYVTGASYGYGTDRDYATIKYDKYGNELWARRYNGPGNYWDTPAALAVDDSGNVYVTGYSSGYGFDWATIKYDSLGNELWVQRFDGPTSGEDYPLALIMDDTANIYIAGTITDDATGKDAAITKYDSNGNQLWMSTYNGSANGYDRARCIIMDDSAGVYIAGTSEAYSTELDYLILKYNIQGDSLWTLRYSGPGNGTDEVVDIFVDRTMNIYITGYSDGGNSFNDLTTIKYSQPGSIAEKTLWNCRPSTILEVFPNPFSEKVNIRYSRNSIEQETKGREINHALSIKSIKIYDVTGRLVKDFSRSTPYDLQPTQIVWDGRDSEGNTIPEGCYFLKAECDNSTYTKKIVKLRR
jgi:hypothetical protein